jgi:hypothetical protein
LAEVAVKSVGKRLFYIVAVIVTGIKGMYYNPFYVTYRGKGSQ